MLNQPTNEKASYLPFPSISTLEQTVLCHDKLSYLHLDSIWFLFAVEKRLLVFRSLHAELTLFIDVIALRKFIYLFIYLFVYLNF